MALFLSVWVRSSSLIGTKQSLLWSCLISLWTAATPFFESLNTFLEAVRYNELVSMLNVGVGVETL